MQPHKHKIITLQCGICFPNETCKHEQFIIHEEHAIPHKITISNNNDDLKVSNALDEKIISTDAYEDLLPEIINDMLKDLKNND